MIFRLKQLYSRVSTSSLARSSGIYTISSFINAAIPLLLLPILTRRLSPSDYGIVAMFQLSVSIIYPFIGMNLEGAIERKYYNKSENDFPSYIVTCFVLVASSFFTVLVVCLLLFDYILQATQLPIIWLKYVILVALCQFFTSVVLVIFQVRVKPKQYGIFQISQSLFNVLLTILFVVVLNKTWEGRLEAQVITGVVFAIISAIILSRLYKLKFNIKKDDVYHALKLGLPLIPHAIGGMIFTTIDRFFLTKLVGLEQTGNYTVAYQLGAVISLLTIAFNNAYVPWLFDNLNKNDLQIKKRIVKFTYLYFGVIISGTTLVLILFPYIVSIFVGDKFNSINTYSGFIVFGFAFQGMYYMVVNYLIYAQKTYLQAGVTIFIGILKLPITYFAIVWFGAVGASVSYFITFLLFFIATWVLSARTYKMPWFSLR